MTQSVPNPHIQSSKDFLIIALFVGFQAFSPHWDGAQYNPSDPTNRKEALGKSFTDSGRLSKRKHRDVIPQLGWQSCKKEQLRKNCHLCGVTESLTPWLMWPCCVEMLSSRNQSLLLLNWIVGFVKVVTWIFRSCYMYLSKLIHVFLLFVTWISQIWYMGFSKLLHGFLRIDTYISLSWCMDSSTLFHVFLVLYQTKPSWSLTKSSRLIEASALT